MVAGNFFLLFFDGGPTEPHKWELSIQTERFIWVPLREPLECLWRRSEQIKPSLQKLSKAEREGWMVSGNIQCEYALIYVCVWWGIVLFLLHVGLPVGLKHNWDMIEHTGKSLLGRF